MSDEDRAIEAGQDHPALETKSGEVPHHEAYNRWLCFDKDRYEYGCYDANSKKMSATDEDEGGYAPRLFVETADHVFQLEDPDQYSLDRCLGIVEEWRKIIEDQPAICVFGAKWWSDAESPDLSDWLIYGLKSPAGRQMAEVYENPNVDSSVEE